MTESRNQWWYPPSKKIKSARRWPLKRNNSAAQPDGLACDRLSEVLTKHYLASCRKESKMLTSQEAQCGHSALLRPAHLSFLPFFPSLHSPTRQEGTVLFSLQLSASRPGSWGGSTNWWTENEPGVRDLGFNSDSTSHIRVDPEKSNWTLRASVPSPGRLGW